MMSQGNFLVNILNKEIVSVRGQDSQNISQSERFVKKCTIYLPSLYTLSTDYIDDL